MDFQFSFPNFEIHKKNYFPVSGSSLWLSPFLETGQKNSSRWKIAAAPIPKIVSQNTGRIYIFRISYIFNIWISRGKQHCSRGVFLWRDPGLRTSMIFSAFLSGPACSLHGLWGLPLFQLHPQPHFVHNSFDALSKRFLRHVWKVLDLPGEILAKSGLESEFRRSSQKLCPGVPRRRRPASIRTRSWSLWSEGLDKNSETVLKRIHGFAFCHLHLTN